MKEIRLIILSLLYTCACLAQTPAAKLDYLKKNIEIFYLPRPNAPVETLSFAKINPEGIFLDTDGIMLGKTSNSGMDNAALLLSALFKPFREKNSGDIELQELVYNIMHISNKKFKLYFINDIAEPVTRETAESLGFYFQSINDEKALVWPGTFQETKDTVSYAGAIIMGEYRAVAKSFKHVLTRLLINLYMGDFSVMAATGVAELSNTNPPPGMYSDKILHIMYVNADTRKTLSESIGHGLSFLVYGVHREKIFGWLEANPYILIQSTGKSTMFVRDIKIPDEFLLANHLRQQMAKLTDTGHFLTSPPFENPDKEFLRMWKLYNLNVLPPQLIVESQQILGLLFYEYIQKFGQDIFIQNIAYENHKLERTLPQDKFAVFMENLSRKSQSVKSNYLFALAVLDLLLDFPGKKGTVSTNDNNSFFGVFRDRSISTQLMNDYFKVRQDVIAAVDRANRQPGRPYRATGEENFKVMVNAIWDYLMK